jgi:quinolinate synthase
MNTTTYTPLPSSITDLSEEETQARIIEAKRSLGRDVVILGHHYQGDDVIRHADATGDSFKLAQHAAEQKQAKYVVFCGVHFMAESADILTTDQQTVILPDMGAGCSMADMADIDDVEDAWESLEEMGVDDIVPITYMNSTAAIKDFVGRRGGIVCTSGNAVKVLEWAFERGKRAFFLPDQHLARNTGYAMGIALERMPLWSPFADNGGASPADYRHSRIILWEGHCSVHMKFTVEGAQQLRAAHPGMKILVHPECRFDVVQIADEVGSTEYIRRVIDEAPAGSEWAIGTEYHLVHRLAQEYPEKSIVSLSGIQCACATMYRIDPSNLLWALESLVAGEVVNPIRVPSEIAEGATLSLGRMLALKGDGAVAKRRAAEVA